jgi:hypothetical protein
MELGTDGVLIANLRTGEYMVADHGALRDRGMPAGFETAGPGDLPTQSWLDAIADAAGEPRQAMGKTPDLHDTLVNLATGASATQHKGMTRDHGVPHGWTDLAEVGPLDLLDALRAALGREPCDRGDFGQSAPAP